MFGKISGKAEDEAVAVSIRGVKEDDGSVIIRVISPNEAIIKERIKKSIGHKM